MAIDISNYRVVELRDSYDDSMLGVVLLNNKHSVNDFQDAIYKGKEKWANLIYENGDDWGYITRELQDFDYIELDLDDYVEF